MKSLKTPIKVGSHYIDCGQIPRRCVYVGRELYNVKSKFKNATIAGISLVDGSHGICSLRYCSPIKVDKVIAQRWAKTGPLSIAGREALKNFYASEWGNGRAIWWKEIELSEQ